MTYWNFQVWIAVKNCWATIQSSFQKCQLVFLRIGLMLSQLTIFFSTKLWTLGIAYHERSSSKRWGFNHHWNPELGALVLVHSRAQNHDKIQMVTVTRMPGSPPKKLLVDCKFSTIFFLLCMEYNYILKTIVGASSLRGITGEKRCFVFPVFFHELQAFTTAKRTGFPGLFLLFPDQVLDPFPQLIFTPPQEGRLVGSDFFAGNLVGRMKGQGKGMNNLFFFVFWVQKG